MSKSMWGFAPFVFVLGLAAAFDPQPRDDFDESAQAFVEEAWAAGTWQAGATFIAVGDETIFSAAFGSERGDSSSAATATSAFRAAPMTHTFLSALVMQECTQGDLELDDELGGLLPDLVGDDCIVRVRHLMSHTSGFVDCGDLDELREVSTGPAWVFLRAITKQPLVTHPGECVAPNATDTLLLAALLERAAGKPAAEVLEVRLFGKLGMNESGYLRGEDEAVPRDASSSGDELQARAFDLTKVYTSANDLMRFQRALVDHDLFGSDDFERMIQPTKLNDGTRSPYCMGIRQISVDGVRGMSAGGRDREGAMRLVYFPEHDLTVAVVGRSNKPSDDLEVDHLANLLAGLVMAGPDQKIDDLLLNAAAMEPYVGTYQIGCDTLYVKAGEGRIVFEHAIAGTFVLLNQGDDRFVARDDLGLVLTFEVQGGKALSFVLDDHGVQSVATRFHEGDVGR